MDSPQQPPHPAPHKKPYSPPQLRVYGNLAQITAANMMTGNTDFSMTVNNRTS